MGYLNVERFNAFQAMADGSACYPATTTCITAGNDFFGNSFVAPTKSVKEVYENNNITADVDEKILIDTECERMLLVVTKTKGSNDYTGHLELINLSAQHTFNNNRATEKITRTIARGYISHARKFTVADALGNTETYVEAVVRKSGKDRKLSIPITSVLLGDKEFFEKLACAFLEFKKSDSHYLKRYILSLIESNESAMVYSEPRIEDSRIIIPKIDKVRAKAVDGTEVMEALGIDAENSVQDNVFMLMLFAVACIAALFPVFRDLFGNFAPVLFECNDYAAESNKLKKVFDGYLEVKDAKEGGGGIYPLAGLYEGKRQKTIEAVCNSSDSFSVLFADKPVETMKLDHTDFIAIAIQDINPKNFDGAVSWLVKQTADRMEFIENLNILAENYCKAFGNEVRTGVKNTATVILAVADYTLKLTACGEKNAREMIRIILDTLRNSAFGLSKSLAKRFLKSIRSANLSVQRTENFHIGTGTYLYNKGALFIEPKLFEDLAKSFSVKSIDLAKSLASAGLLSSNGVGYQREKRIGDKVHRFYALKETAVFNFGEVGFEPNDFEECRPELMIPIGNTDEKQIFYALENCSGNINGHMQVFGNTRSGKTNFLKHLALKAAYEGACVINVGFDTDLLSGFGDKTTKMAFSQTNSKKTFTARDVVALIDARGYDEKEAFGLDLLELAASSDGRVFASFDDAKTAAKALVEPEVADTIGADIDELEYGKSFDLSTVFTSGKITQIECDDEAQLSLAISAIYQEKKKSKSTSPCLLIVDEAQKLKLDEENPIIRLILRQGAKLGFIAVISSQYLSSKNGDAVVGLKGACDTKFFFKPAKPLDTLHALGYKTSDTEVVELLDNLAVGECLAVGNIATERCFVSKPIKLAIPLVK